MCDAPPAVVEASGSANIDTLPSSPVTSATPNLDSLPAETVVCHILPYLSSAEAAALAHTCARLLHVLRHVRSYHLSRQCTLKFLEDAAFCDEVKAGLPVGRVVPHPFACAIREFHHPPFDFKRARALFADVLADESATEVEKARAHLSLFVINERALGGPYDEVLREAHMAGVKAAASFLVCSSDERDPVRVFEMGVFLLYYELHHIDVQDVDSPQRKAFELFETSASDGCVAAKYFAGICRFGGYGTWVYQPYAISYFEEAAALGHVGAIYELGNCIWDGRDDDRKAVALVRSAADMGYSWAHDWFEGNKDELVQLGLAEGREPTVS